MTTRAEIEARDEHDTFYEPVQRLSGSRLLWVYLRLERLRGVGFSTLEGHHGMISRGAVSARFADVKTELDVRMPPSER